MTSKNIYIAYSTIDIEEGDDTFFVGNADDGIAYAGNSFRKAVYSIEEGHVETWRNGRFVDVVSVKATEKDEE